MGVSVGVYEHVRCPRDVARDEAARVEREAVAAAAVLPPNVVVEVAPGPEPEPKVVAVNVDSFGADIGKKPSTLDDSIRAEPTRRFSELAASKR